MYQIGKLLTDSVNEVILNCDIKKETGASKLIVFEKQLKIQAKSTSYIRANNEEEIDSNLSEVLFYF